MCLDRPQEVRRGNLHCQKHVVGCLISEDCLFWSCGWSSPAIRKVHFLASLLVFMSQTIERTYSNSYGLSNVAGGIFLKGFISLQNFCISTKKMKSKISAATMSSKCNLRWSPHHKLVHKCFVEAIKSLGALVNVLSQNIDGKLWKARKILHNIIVHNICRKCSLFLTGTW